MKRFKNILYVAPDTAQHDAALERAVALAENNQADLMVVGVIPAVTTSLSLPGVGPTPLRTLMADRRRKDLESLVAPYQQRLSIKVELLIGEAFIEVIRKVLRSRHDLLIKPAENPGFMDRLFGSLDTHLLRKCPCPVWLTGPDEKPNYQRILAAVDFDLDGESVASEQELNRQIRELAGSLALSDFAELHFVHVWEAPGEMHVRAWCDDPEQAAAAYLDGERSRHEGAFNRLRGELKGQLGLEAYDHLAPRFHLRRGAASRAIPDLARQLQVDLVVMGTVARTGIPGFFIGNTAEAILEQLQCSVLAVKPPGFVSPVRPQD